MKPKRGGVVRTFSLPSTVHFPSTNFSLHFAPFRYGDGLLPILIPCSRMNELKIISLFRLKQRYLSYKSLMLCLKVNTSDFEDVKAK